MNPIEDECKKLADKCAKEADRSRRTNTKLVLQIAFFGVICAGAVFAPRDVQQWVLGGTAATCFAAALAVSLLRKPHSDAWMKLRQDYLDMAKKD